MSAFVGAYWFDTDPANSLFSVTSGFVTGLNTLTFDVENTGGPGGTLIQDLSGSIQPNSVPKTSSALWLMAGGFGLVFAARRWAV